MAIARPGSSSAVADALDSCSPPGAQVRIPLVALLARVEARFVEEFDRRLKDSEFCALSLAHSTNILRHLHAGPRRASQIVTACDVTKQAISQQIVHLERNGYITVEPDPADARARLLSLTPKGFRAQALVHQMFVDIERDWASLVGSGELDDVRRVLIDLAEALPGRSAGC